MHFKDESGLNPGNAVLFPGFSLFPQGREESAPITKLPLNFVRRGESRNSLVAK